MQPRFDQAFSNPLSKLARELDQWAIEETSSDQ